MEEEELEYAGRTERDSAKWHWTYLTVQALTLVANSANAWRLFFGGVAEDVALHANYQVERDDFEAQAGLEIESLLDGPQEG